MGDIVAEQVSNLKQMLWFAYAAILFFLSFAKLDLVQVGGAMDLFLLILGQSFELTLLAGLMIAVLELDSGASWFWRTILGLLGLALLLLLGSAALIAWYGKVESATIPTAAFIFLLPLKFQIFKLAWTTPEANTNSSERCCQPCTVN